MLLVSPFYTVENRGYADSITKVYMLASDRGRTLYL